MVANPRGANTAPPVAGSQRAGRPVVLPPTHDHGAAVRKLDVAAAARVEWKAPAAAVVCAVWVCARHTPLLPRATPPRTRPRPATAETADATLRMAMAMSRTHTHTASVLISRAGTTPQYHPREDAVPTLSHCVTGRCARAVVKNCELA